ncbi:MAG: septum site-determining protein MinC [bacterium]|nr:septum site-determining protein MinC [bacterium]
MGINVKGEKDYITIKVDGKVDNEAIEALKTQIERNKSFFREGKVLIKYAGEGMPCKALSEIINVLSSIDGITLLGVLTESIPQSEENAIVIKKTLRSGQSISYNGDIVIIGDVNAGAEVIAEGSIIVLGSLRGLAHAGAMGDRSAIVYALDLSPLQIRIADIIARAPNHVKNKSIPEIAKVENDSIVIETFSHGGIR